VHLDVEERKKESKQAIISNEHLRGKKIDLKKRKPQELV
jgi:hypothetical protein